MVRHQQVMLPDTGNVDGYESSDIKACGTLFTN